MAWKIPLLPGIYKIHKSLFSCEYVFWNLTLFAIKSELLQHLAIPQTNMEIIALPVSRTEDKFNRLGEFIETRFYVLSNKEVPSVYTNTSWQSVRWYRYPVIPRPEWARNGGYLYLWTIEREVSAYFQSGRLLQGHNSEIIEWMDECSLCLLSDRVIYYFPQTFRVDQWRWADILFKTEVKWLRKNMFRFYKTDYKRI